MSDRSDLVYLSDMLDSIGEEMGSEMGSGLSFGHLPSQTDYFKVCWYFRGAFFLDRV